MTATEDEAEANLERAVNEYLHAVGADADNAIPTDWMLLVASTPMDIPGVTAYTSAVKNGQLPVHRQLGLLEYALCMLRRNIINMDPED